MQVTWWRSAVGSEVMWRDRGSLMMEDCWRRRSSDRRLEMLEKERLISHDLAVWSGWNFDDRLISLCSFHLHDWTFHRTPEVLKNQSQPLDWEEALTPKSSPPPLWIFLSFGSLLTPSHQQERGRSLGPS